MTTNSNPANNTSTTSNTTMTYPNPIPAPPLNQIFPNHKAAELYLHGFASDHSFEISRLDTQMPTSVISKYGLESSPLPKFDIIERLEHSESHQKVEEEALQAVKEAVEALDHNSPPKLYQPGLNNSKIDIPLQKTPATPLYAPADPPVGLPNSLTEEKRPHKKGNRGKCPKAKPTNHDKLTPVAPPPAPITQGRKRKLPKGWVYSAINEEENSVEPPKKDPLKDAKPLKPAPAVPPQELQPSSMKLQQAKPKNAETPSTTLNHTQTCLPNSSIDTQPPTPDAAKTVEMTKRKRTARRKVKKACQKPRTLEETEVDLQNEAKVLKKWPFVDDLPQYIFPFIENAINVLKDGHCAFSLVEVCLGEQPDQAPTVQTAILNHFHSRGIDWFPMPMGGYLIANTYDWPVIFNSLSNENSKLIPPCFTSYNTELAQHPIVIGYTQDSHFISLEIKMNDWLPIPFLHPDWLELRDPRAANWEIECNMNIEMFTDLKWQQEWIANQDGTFTKKPVGIDNEDDLKDADKETENEDSQEAKEG
ncbi:hypothetical protein DFH28DRAFT_1135859 [Melampsora americana]|nr:hypothetical protein DFH28DRAFT_1135859 [Melampsora americana]